MGLKLFEISKDNNVNVQENPDDIIDCRGKNINLYKAPIYKETGETFQHFVENCGVPYETNKIINGTTIQYYFKEKKIGFNYYTMIDASETLGKKKKGWMLENRTNCLKSSIKLYQILQEEWVEKYDVIKVKLLHMLGAYQTKKIIYTRKCEVREISNDEKNEFLIKYHIQGGDTSKIRLGLFFNNELVAVQTYASKRLCMGIKSNARIKNEYELIRFACDTDYTITGAFGRLQKYFIEKYKPTQITTFADLRFSFDNNIYEKNGYTFGHTSEPNYWYFNYAKGDIHKKHRFNFRKQEVLKRFSPNVSEQLTEYENCIKNSYDRIWDCGNILYIKNINK